MEDAELIIWGIFPGIPIAIAVFWFCLSHTLEKKRTKQLYAIAQRLHCTFSPKKDSTFLYSMKPFQLFSHGGSHKVWNVIHRRIDDVDISVFDYRYTIGSGKNSNTDQQSVLWVRSPSLELPSFIVRPENIFHKIAEVVFGYQDVDFGTHPTFSSRYLLQGQNEPSVRQLFSSPLLSYYEEHPGLMTEGSEEQLIVYRPSQRVATKQIEEFLEQGVELFALFKLETSSKDSLLAALDDEDVQVRKDAVRALGLFQDIRILQPLRPVLTDPHESVRQWAVWSLGILRDARVITLLLHALDDTSGNVREEAVIALWKTCPLVHMIIFGPTTTPPQGGNYRHTVWNPNVSKLTVPMSSLKRIVLNTETYDFHLAERFVTYAINALGQKYLRKHVEVHIYGNPEHIQVNLWNTIRNLFRACFRNPGCRTQ